MVHTSRATGVDHTGCSKRPDFSPALPWRAETRHVPSKTAASDYLLRYRGGWDDPTRATFSPAHPLARRDVPVAQARAFRFLIPFLEEAAEAALYCAHRTSTVSPCAFCEQEGHLAAPSSFFSSRALREHGDRPSYPTSFFSILLAKPVTADSFPYPALFMNTSATIADPLLRRAFGRQARPSDPHRTVGDWAPFILAPVPV